MLTSILFFAADLFRSSFSSDDSEIVRIGFDKCTRPPSTERVFRALPLPSSLLFFAADLFRSSFSSDDSLRLFGSASINAHVLHRRSVSSVPCRCHRQWFSQPTRPVPIDACQAAPTNQLPTTCGPVRGLICDMCLCVSNTEANVRLLFEEEIVLLPRY